MHRLEGQGMADLYREVICLWFMNVNVHGFVIFGLLSIAFAT